jgi:TIR domain
VLVCLSKASTSKIGFVNKEIKFALDAADERPEGERYLIPVLLEPCEVPDRLSVWHWVRLYESDGYNKLVVSLRSRASAIGRI